MTKAEKNRYIDLLYVTEISLSVEKALDEHKDIIAILEHFVKQLKTIPDEKSTN